MSKIKKQKSNENQQSDKKRLEPGKIVTYAIIAIVIILFIVNNWNCKEEKLDFSNQELNQAPSTTEKVSSDIAPTFELKNLDGKVFKSSDYKDKVLIIDFWATWCPPCRKGIPDLIALQKEHKDIQVIGISVDQNPAEVIPNFLKEFGINYPVVIADQKVITDFGKIINPTTQNIENIPTSFVISKSGKLVSKYVGLVEKSTYEEDIKRARD